MNKNITMYVMVALTILSVACETVEQRSTIPEMESPTEQHITLTKEQFLSSGYQIGHPTEQLFESIVTATGTIGVPPRSKASVSAYFGGYVKQIDLLEGQSVVKGQTLFTLEKPEFIDVQKDFLDTKEQLKFLKEDLARQQKLAKASASSQKKLAKAEETYRIMLANHAALYRKLEMMHINPDELSADNLHQTVAVPAPISGHVSVIHTTLGRYLSPEAVALEIISPDHLHLELNVFEQDASRIKEGQAIRFSVQGETLQRNAKVHLTHSNLDTQQHTLTVHGHIEPEDEPGLLVGAYIEAQIIEHSDTFLALPTSAFVEIENLKYVLKVRSESDNEIEFEQVQVSTEQTNDHFTALLNNGILSTKDRILINGAFDLVSNATE